MNGNEAANRPAKEKGSPPGQEREDSKTGMAASIHSKADASLICSKLYILPREPKRFFHALVYQTPPVSGKIEAGNRQIQSRSTTKP